MNNNWLPSSGFVLGFIGGMAVGLMIGSEVEARQHRSKIDFASGRWTAKVWQETDWSKPPLVDVEIGLRNDGVLCWRQARTNK